MTYLPGFENPIGYIEGIRQWRVDGLLLSACSDFLWEPWVVADSGEVTTRNPIEFYDRLVSMANGMIPDGIHAAKPEHDKLLNYDNGVVVTGRVALWGVTFEHERGYRAQYAYPLSFDHCTDRHVNLDELRELYLQPPTDETRAIVQEKMKWISEKRNEQSQSLQLTYQQPTLMWWSLPSSANTYRILPLPHSSSRKSKQRSSSIKVQHPDWYTGRFAGKSDLLNRIRQSREQKSILLQRWKACNGAP